MQTNHSFSLPCLVLHTHELCPGLEKLREDSAAWRRDSCCWGGGAPSYGSLVPAVSCELRAVETAQQAEHWLLGHGAGRLPHSLQRSPELYTGLAPAAWWCFQMGFWAVTQTMSKQIYLHSLPQSLKHRGRRKSSSLVCTEDNGLYSLSPPSFPIKERRFFPFDNLVLSKVSKDNFRAVVFQSFLDLNKH